MFFQITFRRFYLGREGMHPLQQPDHSSDLRHAAFHQAISLPLWAQSFAFVILACFPLVVLKWRRKEAVAERQTSTPLFRDFGASFTRRPWIDACYCAPNI
jgi:hypothetical protein